MNDELSKNPIVPPEPPGRFKMKMEKGRMIMEIIAPKGWNMDKHSGLANFNFDVPITGKKEMIEIMTRFIEALEEI